MSYRHEDGSRCVDNRPGITKLGQDALGEGILCQDLFYWGSVTPCTRCLRSHIEMSAGKEYSYVLSFRISSGTIAHDGDIPAVLAARHVMNVPVVLRAPCRNGAWPRRGRFPLHERHGRMSIADEKMTLVLENVAVAEAWMCVFAADRPPGVPALSVQSGHG